MGGINHTRQFHDSTQWYHRPLSVRVGEGNCGAHVLSYVYQLVSEQDEHQVTEQHIHDIRKYVRHILCSKNKHLKDIFGEVDAWVKSMEEDEEDAGGEIGFRQK